MKFLIGSDLPEKDKKLTTKNPAQKNATNNAVSYIGNKVDDWYKAWIKDPKTRDLEFELTPEQATKLADHTYKTAWDGGVDPANVIYQLLRDGGPYETEAVKKMLEQRPELANTDLLACALVTLSRDNPSSDEAKQTFARRFEMIKAIYEAVKQRRGEDLEVAKQALEEALIRYDADQTDENKLKVKQAKRVCGDMKVLEEVVDRAKWIEAIELDFEPSMDEIEKIRNKAYDTVADQLSVLLDHSQKNGWTLVGVAAAGVGLFFAVAIFVPVAGVVVVPVIFSLFILSVGGTLFSKAADFIYNDVIQVLREVGGSIGGGIESFTKWAEQKITTNDEQKYLYEQEKREKDKEKQQASQTGKTSNIPPGAENWSPEDLAALQRLQGLGGAFPPGEQPEGSVPEQRGRQQGRGGGIPAY